MGQFTEIVSDIQAGLEFVGRVGYPVRIRPSFTLQGAGWATAHSEENLREFLQKGLDLSPVHEVLLDAAP